MDTTKYRKEYSKNKRRKLFKLLIYVMVISVILGVFYVAVISKNEKELVKTSFDVYFKNIKTGNTDSFMCLINNVVNNVVLTFVVWILGISIIGIPVSIIYLIFKSFVLGFTISSLIYTYSFKNLIPIIIYIIPFIINLFVIFIITFYAINFSKMLYLFLFKKKDVNLKRMSMIYLKFLCASVLILFISSIVSSYLVPFLLKSFTNLAL